MEYNKYRTHKCAQKKRKKGTSASRLTLTSSLSAAIPTISVVSRRDLWATFLMTSSLR